MSRSIEAILSSVSPEIARRVEEHKAKDKAATKLAAFQAAERAAMAARKDQRKVTVRAKMWVAEKLAEVLGLQRSM